VAETASVTESTLQGVVTAGMDRERVTAEGESHDVPFEPYAPRAPSRERSQESFPTNAINRDNTVTRTHSKLEVIPVPLLDQALADASNEK
jgi:hypothetical protein